MGVLFMIWCDCHHFWLNVTMKLNEPQCFFKHGCSTSKVSFGSNPRRTLLMHGSPCFLDLWSSVGWSIDLCKYTNQWANSSNHNVRLKVGCYAWRLEMLPWRQTHSLSSPCSISWGFGKQRCPGLGRRFGVLALCLHCGMWSNDHL